MPYVKLFSSLLDSTVWDTSPETRIVWIAMLAMADRDGNVSASVPGLAKRAGVERGACERALALFMAPDPDSRTKDFEGRRIREIDGGWLILNYEKYRDMATREASLEADAARKRRSRERKKRETAEAKEPPVSPDASGDVQNHPDDVRDVRDVRHSAADAPSFSSSAQRVTDPNAHTRAGEDVRTETEPDSREGAEPEPDQPSLAYAVRNGFETRYRELRNASLPQGETAGKQFSTIVRWVRETAVVRNCDPFALAERLMAGFFGNERALANGLRLSWLARDPTEYDPTMHASGALIVPPPGPDELQAADERRRAERIASGRLLPGDRHYLAAEREAGAQQPVSGVITPETVHADGKN